MTATRQRPHLGLGHFGWMSRRQFLARGVGLSASLAILRPQRTDGAGYAPKSVSAVAPLRLQDDADPDNGEPRLPTPYLVIPYADDDDGNRPLANICNIQRRCHAIRIDGDTLADRQATRGMNGALSVIVENRGALGAAVTVRLYDVPFELPGLILLPLIFGGDTVLSVGCQDVERAAPDKVNQFQGRFAVKNSRLIGQYSLYMPASSTSEIPAMEWSLQDDIFGVRDPNATLESLSIPCVAIIAEITTALDRARPITIQGNRQSFFATKQDRHYASQTLLFLSEVS